jgi:ABC-type glycerol-3-phosphate transport system substrate-binding protein
MTKRISRRRALTATAAAAALPLVHIRTAGAAGKLSLAIWDHWVPTGDAALKKLVDAWADKNKVEVQLDFLTAIGEKINITMAAEAQADRARRLCVRYVDRARILGQADTGRRSHEDADRAVRQGRQAYEYLGVADGAWRAVPVAWGSAPLTPCGRISMLKQYAGIDVQKWFPNAKSTPEASKDWTYETQLKAAEACHKAGFTFGLGCGSGSTDARQTWGATFGAFGAHLLDAKGNITVDTDTVREAMDYCKRLIPFMPADTVQYDDASNNRALISGKSALIWNPPSAWAVAKRDAPQVAEDCWTFSNPRGPKGRMVPHRPYFWGIWNFSKATSAAKDILLYLSQREQVEAWPMPSPAMTFRHSRRSTTSRSGKMSNRRKARSTTIRFAPGMTPSTTSPGPRVRPRSRCRCGTAASFRAWSAGWSRVRPSKSRWIGRRASWKGSRGNVNPLAIEWRSLRSANLADAARLRIADDE